MAEVPQVPIAPEDVDTLNPQAADGSEVKSLTTDEYDEINRQAEEEAGSGNFDGVLALRRRAYELAGATQEETPEKAPKVIFIKNAETGEITSLEVTTIGSAALNFPRRSPTDAAYDQVMDDHPRNTRPR